MNCLLILTVFTVVASADIDKKECEKLFGSHATHCCKKTADLHEKFMKSEDIKECFQRSMDPATCEVDLCIAKKRGFATDDDKLDMEKLKEIVTKDFRSDADLISDIKSKCLNGDLDNYGPIKFCDFFKMKQCISVQLLKNCPEWNSNDACNEFQSLVQVCGKSML